MVRKKSIHSTGCTILICDDDEFISNLYAYKFEQEGYTVIVVSSGDQVIPALTENKIDLVILDLMLPKMTGFEILQKLQTDSYSGLHKIPIVAVSNLGQKSDMDAALKYGAVDFIVKSNVTPKELLERLQTFMPRKEDQTFVTL